MLAVSSRKSKNKYAGGGSTNQTLEYLDPTMSPPNAPAGLDLLKQNGLIVRPVIPRQSGGGSSDQPLAYLDPTIPSPSAGPSADLLKQNGLIVRPAIERQSGGNKGGEKSGGFLPSVMKGVVNSGVIVAPLAVMAAQRMMNGTRKRGGGKKENWAQNREAAKEELAKYGKPSALNVNKYAALKRKSEEDADEWLTGYILKKRKTAKKPKKVAKSKTEKASKANVAEVKTAALWKNLVERAKKDLEQYGKPSGANARKFASLHKKGLNTAAFLANYQTRKRYVAPAQVKTGRNTYKNNLQKAKQYLSTFGKPTATNLSKYVSLKRKGESVKAVENAVRSRVKPVTVKPSALKPTSRSPPPPNMEKVRKQLQLLKQKIKTYD